MSSQTDPRREHPSTYFVQDRSNEEELKRLRVQDQLVTASMGGVLVEQLDPASFGRVLDVGCGTGNWLIEAAKTYPNMSLLVGVDISGKMVEYALAQAEAQGVSDRMEFHVMDALRMLEFPTDFFDLVNLRFSAGWLRTWEWPKLLQEFQRVARAGGVIRITEGDIGMQSPSPALTRLFELTLVASHQAGYLFTQGSKGVTGDLAPLLRRHGLQQVQTRAYMPEYRAGTPEGQRIYEDMKLLFRTVVPFLRKWTRLPDDYEALYQQALSEIQQPDFVARGSLLTVWGNNPPE